MPDGIWRFKSATPHLHALITSLDALTILQAAAHAIDPYPKSQLTVTQKPVATPPLFFG